MPGRRISNTPRKPSTMEPMRLTVKRSPSSSTASTPAQIGIRNSIANTVASGSTMTALVQHKFAMKCVPLRMRCTPGLRSARYPNNEGRAVIRTSKRNRPPRLRTINSSNRLSTPPSWRTEIAISENDSSVPIIHRMAAGRLELRGTTDFGGSGSPSAPASTGVTTQVSLLFGVRLVFRPRLVEGRELEAGRIDRRDLRVLGKVHLEAAGVEHLRHEAEVGHRDMRPECVGAGADQRFDRIEALRHPMPVPFIHRRLIVLQRAFEIIERRQVVERVNIAGDHLR